jgi:murein DD-endopeptidase MepM/ murein hydrolase activator NlpD
MALPPALQRWEPLIRQAAARHGVPPELLAAIVEFESGGNPTARNRASGASGLGQVMPREAGFPGRPSAQELLDPATNLDWSARILAAPLKRWGSLEQATAAYFGALDAKGNITGSRDANGTSGNQYVGRVMAGYARLLEAQPGAPQGRGAQPPPADVPAGRAVEALPADVPATGAQPVGPTARPAPTNGTVVRRAPGTPPVRLTVGQRAAPAGPAGTVDRTRLPRPAPGQVIVLKQRAAPAPPSASDRTPPQSTGARAPVTAPAAAATVPTAATTAPPPGGQRYWPIVGQRPGAVNNPFGAGQARSAGAEGLKLSSSNTGADLTAPYGAPIVAETSGQVLEVYEPQGDSRGGRGRNATENDGYGGSVMVGYDDGTRAKYSHAAFGSIKVKPGQRVAPAQPLAAAGDSGNATGPHTDYMFWDRSGRLVNGAGQRFLPVPVRPGGGGLGQGGAEMPLEDTPDPGPVTAPAPPPAAPAPAPAPTNKSARQAQAEREAAAAREAVRQWENQASNVERNLQLFQTAERYDPQKHGQSEDPRWRTPDPEFGTVPEGYVIVTSDPVDGVLLISQPYSKAQVEQQVRKLTSDLTFARQQRQAALTSLDKAEATIAAEVDKTEASAGKPPERITVNGVVYERQADGTWKKATGIPEAPPTEAQAPARVTIDGVTYERQPDGTWKKAAGLPEGTPPAAPAPPHAGSPSTEGGLWTYDPKTGWSQVPGTAVARRPGPVSTVDLEQSVLILDENGEPLYVIGKDVDPQPKILGSTSGPYVLQYDPTTQTAEWVENKAFIRKPEEISASPDVQYIVREDPVTGELTREENPAYNPWSSANRLTGQGPAEGKVIHIDRFGQTHVADTLTPEERRLVGRRYTAGTEQAEATVEATRAGTEQTRTATEQARFDLERDRKEAEEFQAVEEAIRAGASPAEVRGLVLQAARNVADWTNLQNAETSRQTQLEAARHNLAQEESEQRGRRTAEAAEARQGAAGYRMATAPFQTALLGSLSQVADPRAVARSMNIAPGVSEPVATMWDQRQAEQRATAQQRQAAAARQQEPWFAPSPFSARPAQPGALPGAAQPAPAQQGAQAQPPARQTQPAAQQGVSARLPGQSYTGAVDEARQAVDLGTGRARTYYQDNTYEDWPIPQQGEAPAAPGPEPQPQGRQPDPDRAAVDLESEGRPGWARTYYLDGSYEDWEIPQGGGARAAPPAAPPDAPPTPADTRPGPEAIGVGGYYVGGGVYPGHPEGGGSFMVPMYVPRFAPGGAGQGGGGGGSADGRPLRRRLPVPGRHAVPTGELGWVQTEYDDGALETWHVEDGPAWEGVGGMGAGYHGQDPPGMGSGWDVGTARGGGSIWQLPPPASTNVGFGAQTALAQPDQPQPGSASAGTAGGYGGPQPSGGGEGGGVYGRTGGGAYGAGSGASPFGTVAPPTIRSPGEPGQQALAPGWDMASPSPFSTHGVGGPSGSAGQATLYGRGASAVPVGVLPGAGGGRGGAATTAPPRSGSYYGGPTLPGPMSPLQRLLTQAGVVPLSAGRAAGSPATV